MNDIRYPRAPALNVEHWFNTPDDISLESLLGKVVVIESFQMLCRGCVSHGLPQASRVYAQFPQDKVAVIGLHTVFEHHDVMTPPALLTFISEYQIPFPVAVDMPSRTSDIPLTMQAYAMRGTPTLTIIDQQGYIRQQYFGQVSDLALGAEIGALLNQSPSTLETHKNSTPSGCSDGQCII
ncbi:alkyl hydroperoxide reductase [Citrobacter amalonaticus]|uniref:Alkyl hydroperoxide reductase n=1 Tax=Citrobacter amalonaticus TaxID=35703 RepID=A0A2S4S4B7_CITAM|nr:redoxin domain-containing protein [Citrobacter amalonaticus]POT60132.1 alkyl hydroperoxide reductase [Citrobacter amalonaticus]POT78335.1 alkyl hydroperoxide reductase [Citrobacter amalonaticus]POU68725.1 alkyl hydroperoxide reductase [Citrobacter amalonaticus]POV08329.1 alkyl hydroperoxide reductase [Citrobacter amalonaticus]